jgi:hypothetical protein
MFSLGSFFHGFLVSVLGCLLSCVIYFLMVVVDVVLNAPSKLKTIIDGMQINIIVLQRFPKSFNPNIIQSPSFAIHGYSYPFLFKVFNPKCTGILATLVAIYNLRFTIRSNSYLQNIFTPLGTHRVADDPANNLATVNINDGRHVPLIPILVRFLRL